jgi:hypothetical protein
MRLAPHHAPDGRDRAPRPLDRPRATVAAALLAILASLAGCAVGPPPGGPMPSQPIARMSLQPEYRVFHDALVDYGEWILIEPVGFVFRPRVNFDAWRPYNDGFWTPTDIYGWVWVSSEPFGWATYHYGNWFYDGYQGWVWAPGVDWGPAWVSWSTSGAYAGWAPTPPPNVRVAQAQVDATQWAPVAALGSPDLKGQVRTTRALGVELTSVRPADNPATIEGVKVNTGPSFDWVERNGAGPLTIGRLQDLVPTDEPLVPAADGRGGSRRPRGGGRSPSRRSARPSARRARRAGRAARRSPGFRSCARSACRRRAARSRRPSGRSATRRAEAR